eukprot:1480952-Amphidinium_carterae.1
MSCRPCPGGSQAPNKVIHSSNVVAPNGMSDWQEVEEGDQAPSEIAMATMGLLEGYPQPFGEHVCNYRAT